MWVFKCENNSLYYLWQKQNYTIGRKNSDIIISNDDSISRNHALLQIENNRVFLTDKGSKYGTFIKDVKLKPNEKYGLQENDDIKFGLLDGEQSKFKLQKLKISVVTSNVKSSDKKDLSSYLEFLNANRTTSWNKTCTHIVVSEVILTAKVLCALTEQQPIVSVKFFQDYVNSIKNCLPLPNPKDYLPEINETLLSKNLKLEYNPNRKTLFNNKIFVFLTEKCKVQMAELILITGGTSISWEKNKFDINILKKDSSNYIFLEENLGDINQNSDMFKSFTNCVKLLSDAGKRSIPLQEIALAIVHNSCEEYCNPLFNRAALLFVQPTQESQQSEEILVYNTEENVTSTQNKNNTQTSENIHVEVMPSYEVTVDEISSISNNTSSLKRPLEEDTHKDTANKRMKDNGQATNNLFAFKKSSSSSQSTNVSKNVFNFAVPTSASKPKHHVEENADEENPFMIKKRKAINDIAPPPKKTPLENISNITKPNIIPSTSFQKNNATCNKNDTTSTIVRSNTWLTKDVIKKEIFNDDEEMDIKPEKSFDEEILKLHDKFRNSIVIEYLPLVIKKEKNFEDETNREVNYLTSHKNFKKFKKVQIPKYQTIIITDDQMSRFVVGNTAKQVLSDDEVEETPEMEMIEKRISVQKTPVRKRGRFQFSV